MAIKELAVTLAADGIKRFGRDLFDPEFTEAMLSYQQEMSRTGAMLWCPRQREHYRKLGLPGLIGQNKP